MTGCGMSPARFRLALAELEPGEVAVVAVADDQHAPENTLAIFRVLRDEQGARPSLRALVVSGVAAGVAGCAVAVLAWTDAGPPPAVIEQLGEHGVLVLGPDDDEGAAP